MLYRIDWRDMQNTLYWPPWVRRLVIRSTFGNGLNDDEWIAYLMWRDRAIGTNKSDKSKHGGAKS